MKFLKISSQVAWLALFLSLAPVAPLAHARTDAPAIDSAAIDQTVTTLMREQNIPGLALGITHNGKPIYAKGFGKADLEHDLPVTTDSVFMIGSISKPMLAVGVMMLAQQGKLALDDPVSKHLPGTPDSWRGITLRHLLNHTAGILRESPAFDGDKVKSDMEVVAAAFPLPLEFPTGSKMQYCNVCYFSLAEIISRRSGEAWPTFMVNRIFAPSGMSVTRTTSPIDLVPKRVASYSWASGVYRNEREYLALRPSGAFLSSLNDMLKWEAALYDNRLIPADVLAAMTVPTKLNDGSVARRDGNGTPYGLGWSLSTVSRPDGESRVSHGGSLAGFRSLHARYSQSGFAVIVLANSSSARLGAIEEKIYALVRSKNAK